MHRLCVKHSSSFNSTTTSVFPQRWLNANQKQSYSRSIYHPSTIDGRRTSARAERKRDPAEFVGSKSDAMVGASAVTAGLLHLATTTLTVPARPVGRLVVFDYLLGTSLRRSLFCNETCSTATSSRTSHRNLPANGPTIRAQNLRLTSSHCLRVARRPRASWAFRASAAIWQVRRAQRASFSPCFAFAHRTPVAS